MHNRTFIEGAIRGKTESFEVRTSLTAAGPVGWLVGGVFALGMAIAGLVVINLTFDTTIDTIEPWV